MDEARTTTLQEQARALGDPTRHAIFQYVADASRAVEIAELTEHFGFNHNAIRQHLAKLVAAQLLAEDRAPSVGRGRPRLVYELDPSAESRWGVTGPYEQLSVLLAEMLRSGDEPVDVGRRSIPRRRLAASELADPVAVVAEVMERRGFDPVVRRTRSRQVDVVLRTCPYASAALADPDSVCGLHLGIAQGVAARTRDRVVVDDLVRHDPRRAGCRLKLTVTDP